MSGTTGELGERFTRFAERECARVSPLYEALARAVAADPDLLALGARARPGQPAPNMLFAAVHFLLLGAAPGDPLARFYPDLTERPSPPEAAVPAFRAFCLRHEGAIAAILGTRVVSTNEVLRAACLLPAFAEVARLAGRPLHLIEVGASAGLLLLFDRYRYDYGQAGVIGNREAPLTLVCDVRGARELPLLERLPAVASRRGIDPYPLNPADPQDAAWLRALLWPEQEERAARLERALAVARADPPPMIAGEAIARLPAMLQALPRDGAPCVVHTFTLNQFSETARAAFDVLLHAAGRGRPVWRIGLEWGGGAAPELRLTAYDGAEVRETTLARSLVSVHDSHLRAEKNGPPLEWRRTAE